MTTKEIIDCYLDGRTSVRITYKQFHWIMVMASKEGVSTLRDGVGCTIFFPDQKFIIRGGAVTHGNYSPRLTLEQHAS